MDRLKLNEMIRKYDKGRVITIGRSESGDDHGRHLTQVIARKMGRKAVMSGTSMPTLALTPNVAKALAGASMSALFNRVPAPELLFKLEERTAVDSDDEDD